MHGSDASQESTGLRIGEVSQGAHKLDQIAAPVASRETVPEFFIALHYKGVRIVGVRMDWARAYEPVGASGSESAEHPIGVEHGFDGYPFFELPEGVIHCSAHDDLLEREDKVERVRGGPSGPLFFFSPPASTPGLIDVSFLKIRGWRVLFRGSDF